MKSRKQVVAELTDSCRRVSCRRVGLSPTWLSPRWLVTEMTAHWV